MMSNKTQWIKYAGMSFNATVLGAKSKEEFFAHEGHNFADTPAGKTQLEEAYLHIQAKVNPVKAEPAPVKATKEEKK